MTTSFDKKWIIIPSILLFTVILALAIRWMLTEKPQKPLSEIEINQIKQKIRDLDGKCGRNNEWVFLTLREGDDLEFLKPMASTLESLDINCMNCDPGVLFALGEMPKLNSLELKGTNWPRIEPKLMPAMESVFLGYTEFDRSQHGLEIDVPKDNLDETIRVIATFGSLIRLNLYDNGIRDSHLRMLEGLSVNRLVIESPHITNQSLQQIGKFEMLTALQIQSQHVDDDGLRYLNKLTELDLLVLRGCSQINGSGIDSFPELKQLLMLELDETSFNDAACKNLEKFPKLIHLNLNKTKVGDLGMQSVGKLKQLDGLGLFGTNVSDQGVAALTNLPNLKNINLDQTKISERCLDDLIKIESLRSVSATDTPLEGVDIKTARTKANSGDGK